MRTDGVSPRKSIPKSYVSRFSRCYFHFLHSKLDFLLSHPLLLDYKFPRTLELLLLSFLETFSPFHKNSSETPFAISSSSFDALFQTQVQKIILQSSTNQSSWCNMQVINSQILHWYIFHLLLPISCFINSTFDCFIIFFQITGFRSPQNFCFQLLGDFSSFLVELHGRFGQFKSLIRCILLNHNNIFVPLCQFLFNEA